VMMLSEEIRRETEYDWVVDAEAVGLFLDWADTAAQLEAENERYNDLRTRINRDVDRLVSPCSRCGNVVPFDYVVDDEFWQRIVPKEWWSNVLCLSCLDILACEHDESVHDHLSLIYFGGQRVTSVMFAEVALGGE